MSSNVNPTQQMYPTLIVWMHRQWVYGVPKKSFFYRTRSALPWYLRPCRKIIPKIPFSEFWHQHPQQLKLNLNTIYTFLTLTKSFCYLNINNNFQMLTTWLYAFLPARYESDKKHIWLRNVALPRICGLHKRTMPTFSLATGFLLDEKIQKRWDLYALS